MECVDTSPVLTSSSPLRHRSGVFRYSGTRGVYARVNVVPTELYRIQAILRESGIPVSALSTDFHITVAHSVWSSVGLDKLKAELWEHLYTTESPGKYQYTVKGISYWRGDSRRGYIVLDVDSSELHSLHHKFVKLGAVHEYEEYCPHITLAKEVGDLNLKLISCIDTANTAILRDSILKDPDPAFGLTCSDLRRWP